MEPDEIGMRELAELGRSIYDQQLRSILEPGHNGEYVAIHVDTGEYALGKSFTAALRGIRQRLEPGRLVGLKIGPEPDYALAARLGPTYSLDQVSK